MDDEGMESVYKKKKLDCGVTGCSSCTFTHNSFPITTPGRIVKSENTSSPPLLIDINNNNYNNDNQSNKTDDDNHNNNNNNNNNNTNNHDADAQYHNVSNGSTTKMNEYFKSHEDCRHSHSDSRERNCVGRRFIQSPPSKKLWLPESSAEQSSDKQITNRTYRDDKYRHPIFATTDDLKTDHRVLGVNTWDKHMKPYGLNHRPFGMQCVPSRKNGHFVDSHSHPSMVNKNVYIECNGDGSVGNGDRDRYRNPENPASYQDIRDDHMRSFVRINSRGDIHPSLLSTGHFKSHSFISSREANRSPDRSQHNDLRSSRRSVSFNPMSVMNFGILEKNDHYIVVFAEINGKRYEGSLNIERKIP